MAKVGRHKVSKKLRDEYAKLPLKQLDLTVPNADPEAGPLDFQLTKADILATVSYLVKLHNNDPDYYRDDIDHFGNRRVRSVGELIQNQVRVGLSRMERVVRERMTTQDVEAITPQTLINIRPVVAAIKEFFGSSQLSQFMDQTNPLAGLTHKRRLSALGPGGLSRERAGFEVRDVHPSHYGRMCPIETPEGPNIGLIGYLSSFARINRFGFIETPYRKVDERPGHRADRLPRGRRRGPLRHRAGQRASSTRRATSSTTRCWCGPVVARSSSSTRTRSTTWTCRRSRSSRSRTALIPFLEHDDANRALMGANMQRQAVPLAAGHGAVHRHRRGGPCGPRRRRPVLAKGDGTVVDVDGTSITVDYADGPEEEGHAPARQVPPVEPGHLHQPEAARATSATRWPRATCSPTARPPTRASSRSARTCSWRSCRGRATTSRTRSSSRSAS